MKTRHNPEQRGSKVTDSETASPDKTHYSFDHLRVGPATCDLVTWEKCLQATNQMACGIELPAPSHNHSVFWSESVTI